MARAYFRALSYLDELPAYGVVEQAHSMPKQGVASSFKFGSYYGAALGAVAASFVPSKLVQSRWWKRQYGLTADKETSLELARQLFPDAPLKRKKDADRAEALLLACIARQIRRGETVQSPIFFMP